MRNNACYIVVIFCALLTLSFSSCGSGTGGGGCVGDECGNGEYLGGFQWTYYYIAFEADYTGPKDGKIYLSDGTEIAVRQAFADDVAIEGTGVLDDGDDTMINLADPCDESVPADVCFATVDRARYPYGIGSDDNALEPWRTVAAEASAATGFSFGEKLYIEELDGVRLPDVEGGFFDPEEYGFTWDVEHACYTHDGCVTVGDTGAGVTGRHLDFFSLKESYYIDIDAAMDEATSVHVYADSPKCE
jgi:hypothetical protein